MLSRSGQQVVGSRGLAVLSLDAGPAWRLYVGHRERKEQLNTTSPTSLETAEILPKAVKTLIHPGIMTQLSAPDSSEEESDKAFCRHTSELKRNIRGSMSSPKKSLSLSLCRSVSLFSFLEVTPMPQIISREMWRHLYNSVWRHYER